jgi:hypothetical protein
MVLVFKYILPKRYLGLTIWPFIFLKNNTLKNDAVLLYHEQIHLRQQVEMLVLPFFIWYVVEWFIWLLITRNPQKAYYNISFEREAYANETNFEYLHHKPFWNFLKYVGKKASV